MSAPESLVDWHYWLSTWPTEPVLLTRANAADGYPRALTPLSQDLILPFEEAGVRRFFEERLRAVSPSDAPMPYMWALWGHVYLNADQLANLGAALPGSSRQSMYQQYLGLRPDPEFAAPTGPTIARLAASLRAGPVAVGMLASVRQARRRFTDQVTRIRALRPTGQPDQRECLSWLLRLEALMPAAWESLMIGAGIASATFAMCEQVLTRATGGHAGDLNNRLHVGLGGNESAEAGRLVSRLAALARANPALAEAVAANAAPSQLGELDAAFGRELSAGLDRFGFRAAPELELAQPSWRQQPGQLLAMVARELRRPPGADRAQVDRAVDVRAAAEAELARRVRGPLRPLVRRVLRMSREQMALRENGKVPIVLIFDEVRRVLEAAGPALVARGTLPEGADAVYLRYDELKGLLAGASGPAAGELARRAEEHKRCLRLVLPELIEAGPGYAVSITDRHIRRRGLLPAEPAGEAPSVLAGVGASAGRVTATARVLADPLDEFEPGDVLVAKTVDPGWSAALACAGAVVLDIGGGLSHGAVVARELGIPCVVNVKVGTTVIRDGSQVTVDGSAGQVFLERSNDATGAIAL